VVREQLHGREWAWLGNSILLGEVLRLARALFDSVGLQAMKTWVLERALALEPDAEMYKVDR
jgi:hypothetical protein